MVTVKLTKGAATVIDECDLGIIGSWNWRIHNDRAYGYKNGKQILMHRLILNVTDPKILVDHIDGNPLNNQRSNLRLCTHTENMRNRVSHKNTSSKYRGVSWEPRTNKWKARIVVDKKHKTLGRFLAEDDAAEAYNKKAIEQHGEFARLNKINNTTI